MDGGIKHIVVSSWMSHRSGENVFHLTVPPLFVAESFVAPKNAFINIPHPTNKGMKAIMSNASCQEAVKATKSPPITVTIPAISNPICGPVACRGNI
jgi:hypothetical protein